MSQTHHRRRRRRRSWPRTFLLLIFTAAALAAMYRIVFQKPHVAAAANFPAAASAGTSQASASQEQGTVVNGMERKPDFFTILVSGADDGNGNSDTNILVAFDAGSGAIHCVSIPRDSGMYVRGSAAKINSAYNRGGMEMLSDCISGTLGIPIDFTVEVKLRGFVRLVDAIGGVDFNVPINMDYDDPYQDLSIHLKKGMQHLNGENALKVVRFRHNNDGSGYGSEDIGRIGTQQAFLTAVAKQLLTLSNADKVGELAKLFNEYVNTDLEVSELAWLGKEALSIGTDNITFTTLPGEWSGRRSLYMLDQDAVLELVNSSLNPYTADRTLSDLNLVT